MKSVLAHYVEIVFAATFAIGVVLEGIAVYVANHGEPVMIPIDRSSKLDLSSLFSRSLPGVAPGFGLCLDATTAAVLGVLFLLAAGILGGLLLVAKEVEKTRGALPEISQRPRG